ncbi:F-box/kelch-repeat protein At3g06240-like [Papaver somniferum]|uniref:F-box/kelch-repeat protein At3g06240-like n=1 Tax=Papaver somniferum TaxID=3469 RepID=UPI000E6F468B|nr:F-box/kelch-repeat protein At3g06240-like [Papaver somniferum]
MGGVSSKSKMGSMDEEENTNEKRCPHLPAEIIIEILFRLPHRSLLKFRCVSKLWSVLFNSPKLIDTIQHNFSIMDRIRNDMYCIDNGSLSASSLLDGIDSRIQKIHCPVVDDHFRISFMASCNGLFCIRTTKRHDCSLWDPSRGDYERIPPPPPDPFPVDKFLYRSGSTFVAIGYGFGYDSKSDDYKFVRFTSYLNLNLSEAEIYSLRSNSWKRIQHISYLLSPQTYKYGVFYNGSLHWQSSSSPKALIALHMTDEFIRGISPPENPDFEKFCNTEYIDVLNGCLSMLYSNVDLGYEVWSMKDYGNKESWIKIYSISKLSIPLETGWFGRLRRIACLKSGEILLEVFHLGMNRTTTEALVLYDMKNETSRFLKYHKDTITSLSFHSYVK